MKSAAIVIDAWKLSIFERHLQQGGYATKFQSQFPGEALMLKVDTANLEALAEVVKAANAEAARTKGAT